MMGKMKDSTIKDDSQMFQEMLDHLLANRSDTPPESPAEFDSYIDMHYNLHMFIKGEWTNVGVNFTPVSSSGLILP
jgi:hypothetical protein